MIGHADLRSSIAVLLSLFKRAVLLFFILILHIHFISPYSIVLSSCKSLSYDANVHIIVFFVTLLYFVYEYNLNSDNHHFNYTYYP